MRRSCEAVEVALLQAHDSLPAAGSGAKPAPAEADAFSGIPFAQGPSHASLLALALGGLPLELLALSRGAPSPSCSRGDSACGTCWFGHWAASGPKEVGEEVGEGVVPDLRKACMQHRGRGSA